MDQEELRKRLAALGFGDRLSKDELEQALASEALKPSDHSEEQQTQPIEASFTLVTQDDGRRIEDATKPTNGGRISRGERIEKAPANREPTVEPLFARSLQERLAQLEGQLQRLSEPGSDLDRLFGSIEQAAQQGGLSARQQNVLERELQQLLKDLT